MPIAPVLTRFNYNDYILHIYVKGRSEAFIYTMYDDLKSVKIRAKRYANALNARAIILYDTDYNVVWKEGDC